MVADSPTYTYDAALSSPGHAITATRELIERVRDRLAMAGGIWRRELAVAPGSDASSVAELPADEARTIVVLHEQGWGTSGPTADDQEMIVRRLTRDGPGFLCLLLLDDTPAPAWTKGAAVSVVSGTSIDASAELILRAIRSQGGHVVADSRERALVRRESTARCAQYRDVFLASHRAVSQRVREFEDIADEIGRRVSGLGEKPAAGSRPVQRWPGRCMVQLGPVALTLSWLAHGGSVPAVGRLVVTRWAGIVRHGTDRTPERGGRVGPASATVLREEVFLADATAALSWCWRREGSALQWYTSRELAARCVDGLTAARDAYTPA